MIHIKINGITQQTLLKFIENDYDIDIIDKGDAPKTFHLELTLRELERIQAGEDTIIFYREDALGIIKLPITAVKEVTIW